MQVAVIVAGFVLEVVAWRIVAAGRASVWGLMVGVFAHPRGRGRDRAAPDRLRGRAARRRRRGRRRCPGWRCGRRRSRSWRSPSAGSRSERAVADRYARAAEVSLPAAVAVSLLIAVPGEELFWRNLAQRRSGVSSELLGAVAAWLGYVAANIASGSLPFVAGAIVGGAVWGGLAWWTGGIAASLASHGVWTAMMLVRPPSSGRVRGGGDAGMSFLSTAVRQVLDEGVFCSVATSTPRGPHCTPLVFAFSGGRMWLTTSRGSVKARAWRADPTMAGLVRHGELAVSFTGRVHTYDLLDRGTWGASVAGAPAIARASVRFSKKNARFFAGYAVDARQVPFAWTPPGRVFVGIDVERTALLDERGVDEGKGRWGGDVESRATFRAAKRWRRPAGAAASRGRRAARTRGRGHAHGHRRVRAGRAARAMAGGGAGPVRGAARRSRCRSSTPGRTPPSRSRSIPRRRGGPATWWARWCRGPARSTWSTTWGAGRSRRERWPPRSIRTPGRWCASPPNALVWWKGWSSGSSEVG